MRISGFVAHCAGDNGEISRLLMASHAKLSNAVAIRAYGDEADIGFIFYSAHSAPVASCIFQMASGD